MDLQRLFIILPVYAVIVLVLSGSGLSEWVLKLPLGFLSLWITEGLALIIGIAGSVFYMRPGGYLETHPNLLHFTLSRGAIGLFFSGIFGILSLAQGGFPYTPNLVIVPLAFMLSELAYILGMRAWNDRKARQKEFNNDI